MEFQTERPDELPSREDRRELHVEIGVPLLVSWVFLVMYSPSLSFEPDSYTAFMNSAYWCSLLFMSATLIFFFAFPSKTSALVDHDIVPVATPLVMAAGTLCQLWGFAGYGSPWDVVGGIATGISSAILSLLWVSELSRKRGSEVILRIPLLFTVTVVIVQCLLYLPRYVIVAALVAMPICSGYCLGALLKQRVEDAAPARQVSNDTSSKGSAVLPKTSSLIEVGAMTGIVGLSFGIFGGLAMSSQGYSWSSAMSLLLCLLMLGACVLYAYYRHRQRFFSVVLPVGVLVAFLIPNIHNYGSVSSEMLMSMGETLGSISIELMLICLTAVYARCYSIPCARTLGVSRIPLSLLNSLGYLVAAEQLSEHMQASDWVTCLAFLAVSIGLVALLIALMASSYIDSVTKERSKEAEQPRTDIVADPQTIMRLRCEQIGNAYGLSPRENDVLVLLAKGYSSGAIQEHLHISQGTANSHTRNIYAKLGVHTKDEMIALVDEWDMGGERARQ